MEDKINLIANLILRGIRPGIKLFMQNEKNKEYVSILIFRNNNSECVITKLFSKISLTEMEMKDGTYPCQLSQQKYLIEESDIYSLIKDNLEGYCLINQKIELISMEEFEPLKKN